VQLQQLLQPDLYPENSAHSLASQAQSKVLIYLKTLARTRIDVAARRISPRFSSLISRVGSACMGRQLWGQMWVARRSILLVLVLLAAAALITLRRGSVLHALRLLLQYKRR
jgi:hypothetical protein